MAMPDSLQRLRWDLTALTHRVDQIEQTEPELTAERLRVLTEQVKGLRRAVITVGCGIVGSSIVFAFTVFALIGGNP